MLAYVKNPLLSSSKMVNYFQKYPVFFIRGFFIKGRQWSRRYSKENPVTRKLNYMVLEREKEINSVYVVLVIFYPSYNQK